MHSKGTMQPLFMGGTQTYEPPKSDCTLQLLLRKKVKKKYEAIQELIKMTHI